jgi:hypothetical protein
MQPAVRQGWPLPADLPAARLLHDRFRLPLPSGPRAGPRARIVPEVRTAGSKQWGAEWHGAEKPHIIAPSVAPMSGAVDRAVPAPNQKSQIESVRE